MRAQLDLYRAQHDNRLPPSDTFADFEAAMTTRIDGFGPYISKIPTNPFNNLSTVRFDGRAAGTGEAGWRFDTKTGVFRADSDFGYAQL